MSTTTNNNNRTYNANIASNPAQDYVNNLHLHYVTCCAVSVDNSSWLTGKYFGKYRYDTKNKCKYEWAMYDIALQALNKKSSENK
jgi:hypothetical protein